MRKRKLAADEFYTLEEAAELLRLGCTHQVRRAIKSGELKHYRVGRLVRATGAQIVEWLERGGTTTKMHDAI
jgi:excisionase family DNA binding protein